MGHGRGQHDVDRGPYGNLVQKNAGSFYAASGGFGHNKAALGVHMGPQGAKPLQMLVNGPGTAEVAPAGQRYVRRAKPAQQSTQHVIGSPAAAGGFIGNPAVAQIGAVDFHGVRVYITHLRAKVLQDAQQKRHITDLGHVFNAAGAADHQGRRDNGNSSVFRAADMDLSKQGTTALDNILGQRIAPLC